MPNIGKTMECNCDIAYIFTPVHEMAHFFVNNAIYQMNQTYLNLPVFQNNTEWQWKKPYPGPYGGVDDPQYVAKKEAQMSCPEVEATSEKFGPTYDFIWNSIHQDARTTTSKDVSDLGTELVYSHKEGDKSTVIRGCDYFNHYFIYAGLEKFLNLRGEGKEKLAKRREYSSLRNPNLYNLMKEIWPCENKYISNCEDDAYSEYLETYQ